MPPPDFLHLLTDEERDSLQRRAVARTFKRGAALLREGEAPTRVLVLTEGRAKAVTFTEDPGFMALLNEHPRIWILVHRIVIRRLRLADLQRKEFAGFNTLGRVSSWTGASRESVTKALKQLRDLGWIETGRRTIAVKDREALRRFAR